MNPVVLVAALIAATPLPSWDFHNPDAAKAWVPNSHLANVVVKDGAMLCDAIDWDPMFICEGLSFETTPWQQVTISVRATRSGDCALFWTGTTDGPYGGFSEAKKTSFHLDGDNAWHDVTLLPFWQSEGKIIKLRLDVFDSAHFEIRAIRVAAWGDATTPKTDTFEWPKAADSWRQVSGANNWFAPPVKLAVADKKWAAVQLKAAQDGVAALMWSVANESGLKSEVFVVRGGPTARTYFIDLNANAAWRNDVVALGVRLPEAPSSLESVSLASAPAGPAEMEVTYFGFENAMNRAKRPTRVIARITNRGAEKLGSPPILLKGDSAVHIEPRPVTNPIRELGFNEYEDLEWTVEAATPGAHEFTLNFSGVVLEVVAKKSLAFLPERPVQTADYVPVPHPVQTSIDVAAYYFPGWEKDAKWDPVRKVAPVRKPLLGYYDESNPECVDWQIKWAVENGISVFLVDWYWLKGSQSLSHWFEAYRKSRYRDQLHVAIMWANHNPPGSNSPEDWKNVSREWIDKYFNLPAYYRIDGKPAVFIWDPSNIRNDMGNSDAVHALLDGSQKAARDAGYTGINYVVVNRADSPGLIKMLAQEGYSGATNYHEWGTVTDNSLGGARANFEEVVKSAPAEWARRDAMCKPLTYYPLVDSGWDARPWHGEKSLAILDRTPERFERLLRSAKEYCQAHAKPLVILGPVNEWGEGSYIEPCTEFDFGMLEAIRRVFAKGDSSSWPENIAPSDVGRGPYDYPVPQPAAPTK